VGYDLYELTNSLTIIPDNFVAQCEADPSLFEPGQLRRRIEALDALDAFSGISATEQILARVDRLREKLERANSAVYHSIRNEIQKAHRPSLLLRSIEQCSISIGDPQPGLAYDPLDELISGVLQARQPETTTVQLRPEMVFYQPTPARHILQFIQLSELSSSDTLIDFGSGLGHVPILASILTNAQSIGVEVEQAYIASARECAASLHLDRVTFRHQNATEADLSEGTVFYLYTPFTGHTLNTVLQRLHGRSKDRAITICTLGPCMLTVAAEQWLTPSSIPDPNQITVFRSDMREGLS
jgi:hypothetical protein